MSASPAPASAVAGVAVDEVVGGLGSAVEGMVDLDVDTLDEAAVRRVLAADERAIRRLQAHQSRLVATLTDRRVAEAREQRPDDARAPQRAARGVRTDLTDQLGITPSQAKQVARTGRQVQDLPATRAAHAAGDLTDRHVQVIDEVTAHFTGDERRAFEAELVALAGRCRDAVAFGREARRLLIERDHDAAQADLERKKARRSGRVAQTEDGTTLLRLETAGYAGELVHTVVDAFRTQDAVGEHRTAEQRTHDAILTAFEVALRSGRASRQHGVRPQVAVVVPAEAVREGRGTAETRWSGPLPYREVASVLGDCFLTRLVADARGVPVSVSRRVRTVPAGLWQLLCVRDRGCIVDGCDAPAGWCEVAHLATPYRDDGRLTPGTAGLLCTAGPKHHAVYDNGGGIVEWVDGRPVVRLTAGRRSRPPTPPAARSTTHDAAPAPPSGPRPSTADVTRPTRPARQPRFARETRGTYDAVRASAQVGGAGRRVGEPAARVGGPGRRRCRTVLTPVRPPPT
jgi:hypothetical protein